MYVRLYHVIKDLHKREARYNLKRNLNISVRELVEHILRSGDLERSAFRTGQRNTLEAIRAHQKIQASRPAGYDREVTVCRRFETERFILDISGRIDGVMSTPDSTVVEEIKTTTGDIETLARAENPLHWGQVKCYASLYADECGFDRIVAQLTYYHLGTGEIHEIQRTFKREELEEFFRSLVERYLDWAETLTEWYRIRDDSIAELVFPFETYRAGQRAMAAAVYTAIRDGGRLILQAPTGTGKTMGVLFPALKALGAGLTGKIFYLTARTTGKSIAEQTIDIIRERELRIKSLVLTAREKICLNPGVSCSADECGYARGFYDRINDALAAMFRIDAFTREAIEDVAQRFRVCPFELSLELAQWADCIICDYNYAFDPTVYLRRFFLEDNSDFTFLVDEAHNLPDRAREMFSAELAKQPVLDLRRTIGQALPEVRRCLGTINTRFLELRKCCDTPDRTIYGQEAPSSLFMPLNRFIRTAEKWLVRNISAPFREALIDWYFEASGFLRVAERYDDSYATLYEKDSRDMKVKLFCIDPADQMKEALSRCRSAVFFSATVVPTDYFKHLLGCGDRDSELMLPSPFPPEHLRVIIANRVSTLYKRRDMTKHTVARSIAAFIQEHRGNYLVFFPSYEYLTLIHDIVAAEFPGFETIVQERGMTEAERAEFIGRFCRDNPETLAGFAVMGGVFGEGIDLIGDRLTGAVIVGVGLPGISPERELIRDYFARILNAGFEYAYLYPGMNRVLQAAGRVIRSETDRGAILLIDERFGTARYVSLFPREWETVHVHDEEELRNVMDIFWRGAKSLSS